MEKSLVLLYLQTSTVIKNLLHFHIKSAHATIPPYLATSVNAPKILNSNDKKFYS